MGALVSGKGASPWHGNLYSRLVRELFINFKEKSNFLSHPHLSSDSGDQTRRTLSGTHTLPSAFPDAEIPAAFFSLLDGSVG